MDFHELFNLLQNSDESNQMLKSFVTIRTDIATILERHPKYIREHYLNDMIKRQELEHLFIGGTLPENIPPAEPINPGQWL